jgi:hypothetical protein
MRTVVEQPQLETVSRDFETTMDSTNVIEYCHDRAAKAPDRAEAQLWSFMQVIFGKLRYTVL